MSDIREQFVALGLAAPQKEKVSLGNHQKLCSICKLPVHKENLEKHLKEQHGIFQKVKNNKCVDCPECGAKVLPKNLNKHIAKAHRKTKNTSKENINNRFKESTCHICGKLISGSMKRHKMLAHPARKPEFGEPPPRTPPTPITQEEAHQRRKELGDNKLFQNKAVKDYLNRVPEKPKYGKFGLPQDKYRWGFFGHSTMEYDVWRKN